MEGLSADKVLRLFPFYYPGLFSIYQWRPAMKVKELEELIRESVRETVRKKLKEEASFHHGSIGGNFELGPKVEQAVMLATHCAKLITGAVSQPAGFVGSALEKCFDDILKLFVDSEGGFSVPDLDLDHLKHEFASQLSHQITQPDGKIGKTSRLILDKAVDKLNVYAGETMITEGWGEQEEDGNEHFFSVTLPDMGNSVLIWAEKGHQFLKDKILKTARVHGVEPAAFVDDLERYAIKAWKQQSPTNEYIPGERLSGHHGSILDTVQVVLDELGSSNLQEHKKLVRKKRGS